MLDLTTLYRSARLSIHHAGRSRALVYSHDHAQVFELDAGVARVLSLCQGCKTLDGHAATIAAAGLAGDPRGVLGTLQSLTISGLLRSCVDLADAAASAQPRHVDPITTIAVITADRPRVLQRGLESFARHLDHHGQSARLLVVDGSHAPEHQAANRETAADLAQASGRRFEYAGPAEAAAIRRHLNDSGLAPALLDFALTPGAIGANRNLALLLTAGEHILMADDDIVCEPWTRTPLAGGVAVWGHSDPQESEFFPSRDDVRHAAAWEAGDLLAAHAGQLGQPLAGLLGARGQAADLGETCAHLLGALVDRRPSSVRVTLSGIAGDSGTYCPHSRLFASGPTHARLAGSRETFEQALRGREVLRAARRTTLTHDPRCMAGCMGLVNRGLVPPFMPAGRNEDGVFGATVVALDPLALFAHLPVGVVHDSGRPAAYEDRSMRSASESRVSELLILLTRAAVQTAQSTDAAVRLAGLAAAFEDAAALEPRTFADHVTRVLLDARAQQLVRIEAMVARPAEYPPYWRTALDEYRRTITRSLTRPDFFLPIEFQDAGGVDRGFERLRRFIGDFGGLLRMWPRVLTGALTIGD